MSSTALAALAFLLVVLAVATAFYMVVPIDYCGFGMLGLVVLLFPLHLLIASIVAAMLATLAWLIRARLAAALFSVLVVMTVGMAAWPTFATLRAAAEYDVTLSLGDYVANALHLNDGGPELDRTVQYGTANDGTKLVLDVWPTQRVLADGLRPAVLRVHGGGWINGQRSSLADWDVWLNALGYDVFEVAYRILPLAHWEDEVGDVKCALGWLTANAAKYQIDPARISIMGYSAGGNLAMLAAYSAGDPRLPPSCDTTVNPVRSVINFYGPSELALLYHSSGSLQFTQDALRRYIGGAPAEYPERYYVLSPLNHVGANTPATITLLGTSDRIVPTEQAEILHQRLTKAGAVQEMYLLPGNDHGFDVNWGGFGAQVARTKIEQFLQKYASGSPGQEPQRQEDLGERRGYSISAIRRTASCQ